MKEGTKTFEYAAQHFDGGWFDFSEDSLDILLDIHKEEVKKELEKKALKAFKGNCQYPKDTYGCRCFLCVRWVAGHCELYDGFKEHLRQQLNSK